MDNINECSCTYPEPLPSQQPSTGDSPSALQRLRVRVTYIPMQNDRAARRTDATLMQEVKLGGEEKSQAQEVMSLRLIDYIRDIPEVTSSCL